MMILKWGQLSLQNIVTKLKAIWKLLKEGATIAIGGKRPDRRPTKWAIL